MHKNFAPKFFVWTVRAIFQNRAVPLNKNFFSQNIVQYVDSLVDADMDL